ncbi:MAG: gliding motility-associated C-terminal domain-containing protein [Bacteroidota bacterium]
MRTPSSLHLRLTGNGIIQMISTLPLIFLAFIFLPDRTLAEGSKDFIGNDGYRMFLDTRDTQQMKVYVKGDEFINLGSSHLGIQGGFIRIYRPDGTLHTILNGNNGNEGIIFNRDQEVAGPTGDGTPGSSGYQPWSYKVPDNQEGIWTVYFGYPIYSSADFMNVLNSADWNRATDQPNTPRVVLAWDITVTQVNAGNNGGLPISGRVFTNEYVSLINQNGFTTSPTFHILTKDGFVFEVDFMDADPFRFPISSNNVGFTHDNLQPVYSSQPRSMVNRSADPSSWTSNMYYLYEPQAEDYQNGLIVNNKIFFNTPDKNLPSSARVSDVFRNNPHTTWLRNVPQSYVVEIENFTIVATDSNNNPCNPGSMETGLGAYFQFDSNVSGTASLSLDMTGDGDFNDTQDRIIFSYVNIGSNQIFWDGKDGLGNFLSAADDVNMAYVVEVRGGETHILLTDVENNQGGVAFSLTNNVQPGMPTDQFYYDHTPIGGGVSGNGGPGNPMPTNQPYTYQNNFGNNKILDYWAFFDYDGEGSGTLVFDISDDCNPDPPQGPDKDNDMITDALDLDDDNDGVPDLKEYCNPGNGFACLPNGIDPTTDLDADGNLNFMDANDPSYPNACADNNNDGICDEVPAIFDTDGDGVPDHYDLDSDNDGISDLDEAGHNQPDVDRNGVIDGDPAIFGLNGLYNPIASNPDAFTAVETYQRFDVDLDGVPDHDDLDSDNDGINDVAEAGYAASDSNNDGRIDDGSGQPPVVNQDGLAPLIDPAITGQGIPYPPDKDSDNIPDWHDLDSDNDLIHDVEEGGNPDPDNNAIIGVGTPAVNMDGQASGTGISPTSQPLDTDTDLVPDFHDLDSDNDGINDVREADGTDPNDDGLPGTGPITVDANGIPNSVNGSSLSSSSQPADTDNDAVRDYRDLDSDNDNINDVAETNKPDSDNDGRVGTGIPPVNIDGQATSIAPTSFPTDTDGDGTPDFREIDSDDDGINDVTEANQPDPDFDGIIGAGLPSVDANGLSDSFLSTSKPTDSDADGTADFQELDSDNDGILDVEECPANIPCIDGDNDLTPDFQDPDRDNDGIFDGYECETGFPCPDTDNDGIPDVDDLDTDGDNIVDSDECPLGDPCPDANNNGIPEWREFFCNPNIVTPEVTNLTSSGITFCEGATVSMDAENLINVEGDSVSYQWIGPNGFEFTGMATEFGPFPVSISQMTAANAGEYTLFLFTEAGCVGDPASVTLSVTDIPDAPSLNIEEDVLCEGEMLELNSTTASGTNIEYEWWFDDGNGPVSLGVTDVPTFFINNVTTADIGVYNVSINAGGCSSQLSNSQDIMVDNVLNGMTPFLNVEEDILCEGQTIELNSTSYSGLNVSYHWFFNSGNGPQSIAITNTPTLFIPDADSTNTGIYSVMIFSGNCSSQFSNEQDIEINNDLSYIVPELEVVFDEICEGQTIELNSSAYGGQAIQYIWSFDNGNGPSVIAVTNSPTYFISNATAANSGIYSVSVTMGLCQTTMSNLQDVSVSNDNVSQTPALQVDEDNLCVGEMIELNSSILNGSNITYNWWFDNGATTTLLGSTDIPTFFINDVDTANIGIYTVNATIGNCETPFSNAQDIYISNDLANQIPVLTINENTICEGGMLELNSSTALGNNVVYEWWFNDGTGQISLGITSVPTLFIDSLTAAQEGVYEVTFSVGNCTSQFSNSQDVNVTADLTNQTPSLTINQSTLCEGGMLELNSSIVTGGNVTYEWFFDNGSGAVSLGISDVPTYFINDIDSSFTGVYTVQASVGNCTTQSSNAQDVTINNALGMAPELSVADDVICEGDMLELNSSMIPGNTVEYNWYYNDGSGPILIASTDLPTLFIDDVTLDNSGIYSVGVNVDGCSSQPSNAQDIAVEATPDLNVTNTTDPINVACPGDLVELNVPMVLGAQYQWMGPQGFSSTLVNPIIENANSNNAGDYYVIVETEGCTFISDPTAVYVYDGVAANDDEYQLAEGDSLTTEDFLVNDDLGNVENWEITVVNSPINGTLALRPDNELVYQPNNRFTGGDAFTYEICNTDCPDQCDMAVVNIRVLANNEDEICFVPNIITPNDDGSNDFLTIPCLESEYTDNNLKIFNRWGDLVHEAQPYQNDWSGTYKNVPLPPGTYFYVLQLDRNDEHCLQGYFTLTR